MLERLLQVRRGERTRTALLFLYLFLIVTSYVVTKATRDALFLTRYSAARLPLADMASALAVGAAMSIYLRADRSVAVRSMLVRTLALFSASSFVFWWLSHTSEPRWMLPLLYVWASVFGVLLPAQVWTLANFVVTTREAKRLFGLVGSGAICGWIVGGAVTKALADAYGTPSLLLMTAIAIGICPFLVIAIWQRRRKNSGDEPALDVPVTDECEPSAGIVETGRLIWTSPSLRTIAAVIGIASLVTTIASWQFRAIARQSFADTDSLTAFFGTFNVWAGLLSLAAQLFIVPRLLRRWGIGVSLLVVPVALVIGSLGVLLSGALWSAVVLKGGDQVLRYSIDRSTVELLYLPVPLHQTGRVKAFIDTLIWRLGDLTGSLIVLGCVSLLGTSASAISIVTIVLLVAWIAAARRATDGYVANLRASIYEHRMDTERLSETMDRSTSEVVASALQSESSADILYALSLLADREIPLSLDAVRPLVDHPSADVRKKAISVLAVANDTTVVAAVERRLHDPDAPVRAAALLYLTRVTDVDPLTRLDDLQEIEGPVIASAIA